MERTIFLAGIYSKPYCAFSIHEQRVEARIEDFFAESRSSQKDYKSKNSQETADDEAQDSW